MSTRASEPSQNCRHGQPCCSGAEARPAGRTIWLFGEPAWGTVGKYRGAEPGRPLGSAGQWLQMQPDHFLP